MFRLGRPSARAAGWSALFGLFFFWGFVVGISSARAGLIIEDNLLYFNSSLAASGSSSTSRLLGNIAVGATIPAEYQIGWSVNYISRSDGSGGGTSTLSGTEMGPRFGIFLGKQQWFSLAVVWHPLAKATYTPAGGTAQSLSGTGYEAELGFAPQVGKHLFAGMKLVYDHASYSQSTDASSVTSNVSYSLSSFLPTLYLSWRF